jgi:hypothetical protein
MSCPSRDDQTASQSLSSDSKAQGRPLPHGCDFTEEPETVALGEYGQDKKPDDAHIQKAQQARRDGDDSSVIEAEAYETPRHSYEYTRGRHEPRPVPLGRHSSALSVIRSRGSGARRTRSATSSKRENELQPTTTREGFGHPLIHEKTERDALVGFDGKDDPYRPLNWTFRKKAMTTVLYGLTTAGITFASSVYSAAIPDISRDYNVGPEVSQLGISLMLLGFGLGPLVWAPLSELYGRKAAVLTPYFISAMFSFATGASKDIQSILITRFFAGFFGSAPITNTGGVLGDIWTPQQRGMAMVAYAIAVTGG